MKLVSTQYVTDQEADKIKSVLIREQRADSFESTNLLIGLICMAIFAFILKNNILSGGYLSVVGLLLLVILPGILSKIITKIRMGNKQPASETYMLNIYKGKLKSTITKEPPMIRDGEACDMIGKYNVIPGKLLILNDDDLRGFEAGDSVTIRTIPRDGKEYLLSIEKNIES